MVIIIRRSISFFMTSFAFTSSLVARSATVMPSASVMVRVTGGGADGADGMLGRGPESRRPPAPWRRRPRRWRTVAGGAARALRRLRTHGLRGKRPRAAHRRSWRQARRRPLLLRRRAAPGAGAGAAGRVPPGAGRLRFPVAARGGGGAGGRTSIGRRGGAGGACPVRGSSTRSRSVGGTTRPVGGGITGARAPAAQRRAGVRSRPAPVARGLAGSSAAGAGGATAAAVLERQALLRRFLDDSSGSTTASGASSTIDRLRLDVRDWRGRWCGHDRHRLGDERRRRRRRRNQDGLGLRRRGGGRCVDRRRRAPAWRSSPAAAAAGRAPPSPARAPCRRASAPSPAAGVSANDAFDGTLMLRCRASRSTNCRATTSSIVLDALFTSMP